MGHSFASEEQREALREFVKTIPITSGCYLMRSEDEEILYVGKAKNLRSRVRSYFGKNLAVKVDQLMKRVFRIEFFLTNTEYEALLLENNLIKKHAPFYNISLKDGKTYPVIRVTREDFPRVFRTRNMINDGSSYYGPYVNLGQMDAILEAVDRLYPLRKCREIPLRRRKEPCLFYHLGRCSAPCVGKVSVEKYGESLDEVKELLKGNLKTFRKAMTEKMWEASEALKFEQASIINEILQSLDSLEASQDAVQMSTSSADYLSIAQDDDESCLAIVQVRDGKLIGRDLFFFNTISTAEESLEQFIWQYYEKTEMIPKEIHVSYQIPEEAVELLERGFKERSRQNVKILAPKAGRHFRLLTIAMENARLSLNSRRKEKFALDELKEALNLSHKPMRIDGIDIAHMDGKFPVGVVVSFWEGKPDKAHYRLYNLRSLGGGIDDYKAMKEVIARHYPKTDALPDLLCIDGGKGQLNSALSVVEGLGLEFPVCSLAKRLEEIFVPDQKEPIVLPHGNRALAILQAVRDESHRFSTNQNRKLMGKRLSTLEINQISGIGKERAKKILEAFPSPERLESATIVDLQRQAGLTELLAKKVVDWVALKKVERGSRAEELTGEITAEEADLG